MEAGGHRFQRVPPTERRGRVHTSTVTVAVLDPEAQPRRAGIDARDLKLDWYSGTGKGGQHRNKKACCLRLTHLPTGLVQTATGRERNANYREALAALERRLSALDGAAAHDAANASRRRQVGSGERGDKIRTYRSQDDRVVDHRTGRSARMSDVMAGDFAGLMD